MGGAHYYRNRNKIRLLISEEMADMLLDYKDDSIPENPSSIHYQFVMAHRNVMAAKIESQGIIKASRSVNSLNYKCSSFLEKLTSEFTRRAEKIQLLDNRDL